MFFNSIAQQTFQKRYGLTDGNDVPESLLLTRNDGFIVCGNCMDTLNTNLLATKCFLAFDSLGFLIQSAFYRNMGLLAIAEKTDSTFLSTSSGIFDANGFFNFIVTEINQDGSIVWNKAYFDSSYSLHTSEILSTTNNSFFVAGDSRFMNNSPELMLVKIDSDGNLLWANNYIDSNQGMLDITSTYDGGCMITGICSIGTLNSGMMMMKVDSTGNVLWTKQFGTSGTYARSVKQTSDNGFIFTGQEAVNWLLVKTDSLGNKQWAKKYYGTAFSGTGISVEQTSDGGFILSGLTYQQIASGAIDIPTIMKTDSIGNIAWVASNGENKRVYFIREISNKGFIAIGRIRDGTASDWDMYIAKTDSLGHMHGCNELAITVYEEPFTDTLFNVPATVTPLNLTMSIPIPESGTGGILTTICEPVAIHEIYPITNSPVYPNPFIDNLIINHPVTKGTIFIKDTTGKEVYCTTFTNTTWQQLQLAWLQPGMYFLTVTNNGVGSTKKIIKL